MEDTTQKNTNEPRKKMTEAEFVLAKRTAQISEKFPNGFRRYRVKNYERGEFRAK